MWTRRSFLRTTGVLGTAAPHAQSQRPRRTSSRRPPPSTGSRPTRSRATKTTGARSSRRSRSIARSSTSTPGITVRSRASSPTPSSATSTWRTMAPVHYAGLINRNVETGPPRARRRVRLRPRGAGDHAQRERVAADSSERHRPRAGRRSHHDRAGLPAHADDVGPARRGATRSSSRACSSRCRRRTRISSSGSKKRSRRGRRSCTSATSRISRVSCSRCSGSAGWRGPAASGRSSTARTPARSSRSSSASSSAIRTASACTSGCSRRSAPAFCSSDAIRSRSSGRSRRRPARSDTDIRKFEEIGTAPAATRAAIAEALTFHQAIGGERKAARLLLPDDAVGDAARPASAGADALEPQARPDVGPRDRRDPGRWNPARSRRSSGIGTASSSRAFPDRSRQAPGSITRAFASRRTSTRPCRRSTRSSVR